MTRYDVWVGWFGDDSDWVEVEADTFRQACWKAYEHWSKTGWTDMAVYTPSRKHSRSFDLDQPYRIKRPCGRAAGSCQP